MRKENRKAGKSRKGRNGSLQDIGHLIANIRSGRTAAHAMIIDGQRGDDRDAFVQVLAQGLACTSPVTGRSIYPAGAEAAGAGEGILPCGSCPACRQIAAGTSPDYVRMTMSPGTGKTSPPSYKTADAAEFIRRLSMGAYGRGLTALIDDADTMSEAVQNKLLKTLEEPSPGTHILLAAANRSNLLETVRSRCLTVRLAEYAVPGRKTGRDGDEAGENDGLTGSLLGRDSRFCEFRAGIDKHIKTKEDAFRLLDRAEDHVRDRMIRIYAPDMLPGDEPGNGASRADIRAADPVKLTQMIELISIARMDIRRGMNHGKALRRLWLELR